MDGDIISKPGSTIDIAPTLLNMLDSSLEFKYFLGSDLFSDTDNFVLFSDFLKLYYSVTLYLLLPSG